MRSVEEHFEFSSLVASVPSEPRPWTGCGGFNPVDRWDGRSRDKPMTA